MAGASSGWFGPWLLRYIFAVRLMPSMLKNGSMPYFVLIDVPERV
jgi:hypothetical protein